jgi:hypothetical protein
MNVTGVDRSGLEWTGADIFSAKKGLTVFPDLYGRQEYREAEERNGKFKVKDAKWLLF